MPAGEPGGQGTGEIGTINSLLHHRHPGTRPTFNSPGGAEQRHSDLSHPDNFQAYLLKNCEGAGQISWVPSVPACIGGGRLTTTAFISWEPELILTPKLNLDRIPDLKANRVPKANCLHRLNPDPNANSKTVLTFPRAFIVILDVTDIRPEAQGNLSICYKHNLN